MVIYATVECMEILVKLQILGTSWFMNSLSWFKIPSYNFVEFVLMEHANTPVFIELLLNNITMLQLYSNYQYLR